jgi:hypothetical protein
MSHQREGTAGSQAAFSPADVPLKRTQTGVAKHMDWKWPAVRITAIAAMLLALSSLTAMAMQVGNLSAWALVPFFWCAALLAAIAHYARRQDALSRYRAEHRPLAGPRAGAQLP